MKTKTSEAVLPFHKHLQEILLKWFQHHPHKHVISDQYGKYLFHRPSEPLVILSCFNSFFSESILWFRSHHFFD